jgi:hypothetical protein
MWSEEIDPDAPDSDDDPNHQTDEASASESSSDDDDDDHNTTLNNAINTNHDPATRRAAPARAPPARVRVTPNPNVNPSVNPNPTPNPIAAPAPTRLIPAPPPTRAMTRARGRTDSRLLADFYNAIMKSRDRMAFIRHRDTPTDALKWLLVHIDLDATDPKLAKTVGTYHVKRYTPHHQDRYKYPLTHCRFWPDIRQCNASDRTVLEPLPTSPDKALQCLRTNKLAVWLEDDINLTSDLLTGPFDFTGTPTSKRRNTSRRSYNIDLSDWDKLVINGRKNGIDVAEVDLKPPPS